MPHTEFSSAPLVYLSLVLGMVPGLAQLASCSDTLAPPPFSTEMTHLVSVLAASRRSCFLHGRLPTPVLPLREVRWLLCTVILTSIKKYETEETAACGEDGTLNFLLSCAKTESAVLTVGENREMFLHVASYTTINKS